MSESPANSIIMKLCGRIDTDNSENVKQKLLTGLEGKDPSCVILDADELTYISSAGLRILLRLAKKAKADGKAYSICGATGFVKEVLEQITN